MPLDAIEHLGPRGEHAQVQLAHVEFGLRRRIGREKRLEPAIEPESVHDVRLQPATRAVVGVEDEERNLGFAKASGGDQPR